VSLAKLSPTKSRELREQIDAVEERLELTKVAYERYFNGVDRAPPIKTHEGLKRTMRALAVSRFPSASLRFRMQNLRARLVTYEQYWTRILGQIEKGTFRRVLAESKRRQNLAREAEATKRRLAERAVATDTMNQAGSGAGGKEATLTASRVKKPPVKSSSPQSLALPPGMDARTARNLFRDFVKAKRDAGERTAGLTYGGLVRKLSREMPSLRARHGEDIRFEVATANGKVRLRARGGGNSA